ncbi:MAG: Rrf2 family transcriptional regulator [Xanthobacteraceae bacterium]|nr:Rrf2 family transcriptional regulator [Xanthobacteraceae bacterium]
MRLTRYSDYAMRVLIYLAARPDRVSSISDIANTYGISQNHLMKVVHDLRKAGYIASRRGRNGGVKLALPASDIGVGSLLRLTEDGFDLVDCPNCILTGSCSLSSALDEATAAFLAVLDRYSLADIVEGRRDMLRTILVRNEVSAAGNVS